MSSPTGPSLTHYRSFNSLRMNKKTFLKKKQKKKKKKKGHYSSMYISHYGYTTMAC